MELPVQEMRLEGGTSIGSGRVEVKIRNAWGQICGDLWNYNDALVVCRHFGFNTAQQVPIDTRFNTSLSGYWMTQVRCGGQESDLNQCYYDLHSPIRLQTCSVDYPANVICLGESYIRGYYVESKQLVPLM